MWAKFDEITDPSFFSDLMKTNYLGSVNCCFAAIPFLKKSKGKIVSCSTAQALMGFPNHSGYVASKHALHGFLETISMENKEEITILEAVLSWIRGTNLRGNSFRADGKKHKDESRKHTSQSVSLESCVKSIIDGIKKDKKTIYVPKKLSLIPFLNTFFKNFLQKKVVREINKNKS
jgi:short-subunit dehydrogenase